MTLEEIINRKINMEIDAFTKTLKPSEIIENPSDFDPKKHKYIAYNSKFAGSIIDFSAGNKVWTKVKENKGSLGVLEVCEYSLYFDNSDVTDLGNLRIVYKDFKSRTGNFTSLKNLTFVGGDFDIKGNDKIKDLSNIVAIGEDADISYTALESLKNLMYVGGNLIMKFIRQENIDLGKLYQVGRFIRFEATSEGDEKMIDVYNYLSKKHATSIIPNELYDVKEKFITKYEIILGYANKSDVVYTGGDVSTDTFAGSGIGNVRTFNIQWVKSRSILKQQGGIKIDHNGNIYTL